MKGLEHELGFLGIFYGKVLKTAEVNNKSTKYNLQYNFSISTKCKFDALSFFKVNQLLVKRHISTLPTEDSIIATIQRSYLRFKKSFKNKYLLKTADS